MPRLSTGSRLRSGPCYRRADVASARGRAARAARALWGHTSRTTHDPARVHRRSDRDRAELRLLEPGARAVRAPERDVRDEDPPPVPRFAADAVPSRSDLG